MTDDRLARKQTRARLVITVATGFLAVPSVIWIGMALWDGALTAWVTFGALCGVPVAIWIVAHFAEDKYDRMWRQVGEELDRDRKSE